MKHWLMKCEPSAYAIDDLQRDGSTKWEGVRNYQARNFITGLAEVSREGYPDPSDPTWTLVDIRFVQKFPHIVSLETLKNTPGLEEMVVTKKGSRLSIQPVTKREFDIVVKLGKKK